MPGGDDEPTWHLTSISKVACSCWSRWVKPSGNQICEQQDPMRWVATDEISTGPVPVGSQLVSYHAAKRRNLLSAGLAPEEATTCPATGTSSKRNRNASVILGAQIGVIPGARRSRLTSYPGSNRAC